MPRVYAITRYQREYPPVHQIAAAAVGYKSKARPRRAEKESGGGGFDALLSQFASAGIAVSRAKRKK